jgi:thymidylate kinase
MGNVPVYVFNQLPSTENKNGPVVRSKNPVLAKVMEERRSHFGRPQDQDSYLLERIALESRVIIVEGISGSGKDTFQEYLKSKLRSRVVHDYSEGDLLWSWKHQQIKDIFKMQIRLMRNFLDYVAVTLERDDKALFLLNRFHLSTYTMYTTGITEQATLEREYNMVIKALRALSTHVFLLQLMEGEMEARSSHPERGVAWRRFQQHILEREGFGNFVKRNVALQKAMIETAMRQNIPFSILRLPSAPNQEIAVRRSPNAKIAANLDAAFAPPTQKINPRRHPPQEGL